MNAMPAAGETLTRSSLNQKSGPPLIPTIGSQKPGVIVAAALDPPCDGAEAASSYCRRCFPNAPSTNHSVLGFGGAGTTTVDSQLRGSALGSPDAARPRSV